MFTVLYHVMYASLAVCGIVSLVYLLFAMRCVARFARASGQSSGFRPPVTVLKPICGLEQALYENLRSFCIQDYPEFEIVFGVADPDDPAVAVVERLIAEFPDDRLQLCVDAFIHGANRKVSNLANAYRKASYDILLIADSDIRVDRDYLTQVMAPFAHPDVGAVTCLYTAASAGGTASDLGALFINEWFLPSALVANALQPVRYCFGATMGVRRELLESIGGFARLSSALADDHLLGKLVSASGYKVELVPYLVETVVQEASLRSLVAHELRWAKTVRAAQPLGYAFSFVSYAVPVTLAGVAIAPAQMAGWLLLAAAIGLRLLMHRLVSTRLETPPGTAGIWRILVRDLLSFGIWGAAFFGRTVSWRQHTFLLDAEGNLALRESRAP